MKLSRLTQGVTLHRDQVGQDVEITSLSCDTRTMAPGALFAALAGARHDGNAYIGEALEKGAAAVLCQKAPPYPGPWLEAEDPREAFGLLAANWFGRPADRMTLLGVTGTNGKTTSTYLLRQLLEGVISAKVGLIGTNQNLIGDRVLPAHRTTPDAYELQQLLWQMEQEGCTYVVMEVSSHALALRRTAGLFFRAAIFTNLTRDHLDFHGTMEAYRDAKGLLFRQCSTGIFNLDDETGRYFAAHAPCERRTFSQSRPEAEVRARNRRLWPDRVSFTACIGTECCPVEVPIPGSFTVENTLGVLACGWELGLGMEAMAVCLSGVSGVKGRVEVVPTPAPYTVMIDYAHTPDALEKLLITARECTQGRLICLFGCGGDRDRTKRPAMGALAAQLADLVVLTSDNPRTENPEGILDEIAVGFPPGFSAYRREGNRRKAIRLALQEARTGDMVILAGKGHETYQELEQGRIPLDEREEIASFFHKNEV